MMPMDSEDPVVRIQTANGLFLIDNNGIVEQTARTFRTGADVWIITTTSGISTIVNASTGGYMALQAATTAEGISIITTPTLTRTTSWNIVQNPTIPVVPPMPTSHRIINVFSNRPIQVPGNSSESGVALTQGSNGPVNFQGTIFIFQ